MDSLPGRSLLLRRSYAIISVKHRWRRALLWSGTRHLRFPSLIGGLSILAHSSSSGDLNESPDVVSNRNRHSSAAAPGCRSGRCREASLAEAHPPCAVAVCVPAAMLGQPAPSSQMFSTSSHGLVVVVDPSPNVSVTEPSGPIVALPRLRQCRCQRRPGVSVSPARPASHPRRCQAYRGRERRRPSAATAWKHSRDRTSGETIRAVIRRLPDDDLGARLRPIMILLRLALRWRQIVRDETEFGQHLPDAHRQFVAGRCWRLRHPAQPAEGNLPARRRAERWRRPTGLTLMLRLHFRQRTALGRGGRSEKVYAASL